MTPAPQVSLGQSSLAKYQSNHPGLGTGVSCIRHVPVVLLSVTWYDVSSPILFGLKQLATHQSHCRRKKKFQSHNLNQYWRVLIRFTAEEASQFVQLHGEEIQYVPV